jgi:hypothetical protein
LAGFSISSAEPSHNPAGMLNYGVAESPGFSSVRGMKGKAQEFALGKLNGVLTL